MRRRSAGNPVDRCYKTVSEQRINQSGAPGSAVVVQSPSCRSLIPVLLGETQQDVVVDRVGVSPPVSSATSSSMVDFLCNGDVVLRRVQSCKALLARSETDLVVAVANRQFHMVTELSNARVSAAADLAVALADQQRSHDAKERGRMLLERANLEGRIVSASKSGRTGEISSLQSSILCLDRLLGSSSVIESMASQSQLVSAGPPQITLVADGAAAAPHVDIPASSATSTPLSIFWDPNVRFIHSELHSLKQVPVISCVTVVVLSLCSDRSCRYCFVAAVVNASTVTATASAVAAVAAVLAASARAAAASADAASAVVADGADVVVAGVYMIMQFDIPSGSHSCYVLSVRCSEQWCAEGGHWQCQRKWCCQGSVRWQGQRQIQIQRS